MNIYIGNLPYVTTEEDLRTLFEGYGEVTSVKIITDRMSGQSKGFGFVEMPDSDSAESAIRELNGQDMGGRSLRVNEARPRPERSFQDRRRFDR